MLRAAVFAVVGAAFFAHWMVDDPTFEESAGQSEWWSVLGFSAVLSTLALALPLYGRMVNGRWAFRLSLVAAAGAAVGSVANVFEDGLELEWFFFVFIASTAVMLAALVALALVVGRAGTATRRLLAAIPAATVAATALYVHAGGPIMLAAWLAAAAAALRVGRAHSAGSGAITP